MGNANWRGKIGGGDPVKASHAAYDIITRNDDANRYRTPQRLWALFQALLLIPDVVFAFVNIRCNRPNG